VAGAINKRWREARARAQQRHRELLQARRRQSLDLLDRQAAVCERLERLIEAGMLDDASVSDAESAWLALPKQADAALQESIETRFSSALSAAKTGDPAWTDALEANGERRADLCLHLEILARVDSPPELTQRRMAFQVNRLKDHMRRGEKDPLEGASRLLEEWYLCGPAPAGAAAALDERFRRVRAALDNSGQGTHAA
jgi:hypothetical protein